VERSIRLFGGTSQGQVILETGHSETQTLFRDVWFDRDIDGRWLVWAGHHPGTMMVDGEDEIGAIVVKDTHVAAFIEMLGELIANPAAFSEEPAFEWPCPDETL
jgi:hypothetical protein